MGFKVGDKVKVIGDSLFGGHKLGEIGVIEETNYLCYDNKERVVVIFGDEEDGLYLPSKLELVEPKKTKNQRITELEETVKHFRNELDRAFEIEQWLSQFEPHTPNKQRAEIIGKAKKFVECKVHYLQNSSLCKGGISAKERENPKFASWLTKAEFIVNAEKRTVVAIIRNQNGDRIRAKGIAKCHPSDVFNEHIGKAIALGRALGLDVTEFEQAVQPTLAVAGHTVKWSGTSSLYDVQKVEGVEYTLYSHWFEENLDPLIYHNFNDLCTIINDTNAQYEVNVNG